MEYSWIKVIGLIVFMTFPVLAERTQLRELDDYRRAFFESYRKGDLSSWPGLIDDMGKSHPMELGWQTERVKALYGLTGYQIARRNKKQARIYVSMADECLSTLLKACPMDARLHSLAGAFCGYKISLSFYKAAYLGPRSLAHIEKAIKLDPAEPMGYIEKANSLMYRPAALGRDREQALALYRKALALMRARDKVSADWQYLLLRAFILKGLYETNQTAEAKALREEMRGEFESMGWVEAFVGVTFFDEK